LKNNFMSSSFVCQLCGQSFTLNEKIWRCPCGGLLDIENACLFSTERINTTDFSLWRYAHAIPLKLSSPVTFQEGLTPLERNKMMGHELLLKHDYLFPTASFKDRGTSVLITYLKQLGINNIIEDSSGNAGVSLAAYAARLNMKVRIFVPATTSRKKIEMIEHFGADIELIEAGRSQTADYCLAQAERTFYASHVWHPMFLQGTKTIAFEVAEQLNWRLPDRVILPLGNASLLLGWYLGVEELIRAGIVSKHPQIMAVQAANCAPVYNRFHHLPDNVFQPTLAEGIAVQAPRRMEQILEAIRATNGDVLAVTEAEIKKALKTLYLQGYAVEKTSAVVVAALGSLSNNPNLESLIVLSGHALKTL
jgi:threonine synthase